MKNRIIKVTKGDKIHYEVQRRWLFWWFTEGCNEYDILGMCYGWYPFEFTTEEKAKDFIEQYLITPKKEILNGDDSSMV